MSPLNPQDLEDIQGIAVGRFRKDHQELLFLRFGATPGAHRLISQLAPRIASAWEVQLFNQLFSEIRSRTGTEGIVESTWIGLGISASGYTKLGVNLQELGSGEGANAFRAGMAARSAQQVEDRPEDGPANWLDAFKPGGGVDALVAVASDDVDDLDQTIDALVGQIQDAGVEIVYQERGGTLPPPLTGHEHFGFKDGISQPNIDGVDPPPAAGEPPTVPAGEFVLGYPDNTGTAQPVGTLWARGTFGVFRRLRQDVAAFRAQAQAMTGQTTPNLGADDVEAHLVGRWASGAPSLSARPAIPVTPGFPTLSTTAMIRAVRTRHGSRISAKSTRGTKVVPTRRRTQARTTA